MLLSYNFLMAVSALRHFLFAYIKPIDSTTSLVIEPMALNRQLNANKYHDQVTIYSSSPYSRASLSAAVRPAMYAVV